MTSRFSLLRALLVVPLLAAGFALGPPRPAAAATVCDTGGFLQTGTFAASIVVEPGSTCLLVNAVVRGGVTVGAGAVFYAEDTEIRGAVTGTNAQTVAIFGGTVRGDVSLAGGNRLQLEGSQVRGSVTVSGATFFAELSGAAVRGSVTMNGNAEVLVFGNTIDGNLTCTAGGPQSTYDPNTVKGAENCPAA